MKKYKYPACIFMAFSVLLSNAMCATVAYNYCNMQWKIQYTGCSAPANVAFLLAIPYLAGVAICVMLAWIFYRKYFKLTLMPE